MEQDPSSWLQLLNEHRQAIDDMDEALHDLLIKRSFKAASVGKLKKEIFAKNNTPPLDIIRPEREARILRKLMKNHQGVLPSMAIARLWQLIIATHTRVEIKAALLMVSPQEVSTKSSHDIPSPPLQSSLYDFAREHYGFDIPLTHSSDVDHALHTCMESATTLGLFSHHAHTTQNIPWWACMANNPLFQPLKVMTGLPMVVTDKKQQDTVPKIFTVARMTPASSGEDHSLLVVFSTAKQGDITKALEAHGYPVVYKDCYANPDTQDKGGEEKVFLMGIQGFLLNIPSTLSLPARKIVPLGAYPRPVVARA